MSSIRDPLYGTIKLTERTLAVRNTETFQKMKRIHQTGLLNHVFPSANHSRFEHMLGTMHITGTAIEFLKISGTARVTEEEKELIELAALLHDIGHGPFSHTIEELPSFINSYFGHSPFEKISHEERTQRIILTDRNLGNVLAKEDREKIANFLLGDADIGGVPGELITGDIGTDRMDYLNRDTYHSGLGHRLDVYSILPHLRLYGPQGGRKRVAIAPEGLSAVELFITARYHHFSSLAHSDEWRAREFMLLESLAKLIKSVHIESADRVERLDEITLINRLRNNKDAKTKITRLEKGGALHSAYGIRLNDIRNGVVKYFLYRTNFHPQFKKIYISQATRSLDEDLPSDYKALSPKIDFKVWKHNVPDLVVLSDDGTLPTDEYSPLVADRSALIRATASAQVLASKLNLWCEERPTAEFKRWVRERRAKIHSAEPLIDAYMKVRGKGICSLDFLLIFLHCLDEFRQNFFPAAFSRPKRLKGVVRIYELIEKCQKDLNLKFFKVGKFERDQGQDPFSYSTEIFSVLNALNALNVLRMELWGQKTSGNDGYREVYTFEVIEEKIKDSLLQRQGTGYDEGDIKGTWNPQKRQRI